MIFLGELLLLDHLSKVALDDANTFCHSRFTDVDECHLDET